MEIKKAPKKDLERRKGIFLQFGFIIALSLVLIAFEWSSTNIKVDYKYMNQDVDVLIDLPPITIIKPEVIPPKPVVDFMIISDDPNIVDATVLTLDPEGPVPDLNALIIPIDEPREDEVFRVVEQMPAYPGGESALFRYLAKAVKYPEIARINNVQGKVYVSFVVNNLGEVTQVTIARGVDPNLDREALRVVSSMPRWAPGRQREKPVNVSFTVPINFVLKEQ